MDETMIGPNCGRAVQVMTMREGSWTQKRRRLFCEALANSCNVVAALRSVGMGSRGAYRLRDRDPEFAAQWLAALRLGYDRLETALLRRALRVAGEADGADLPEDDAPFAEMTLAQAMDLLNRHRVTAASGKLLTRVTAVQVPSSQEVDALIMKKIAIVRRQMRKPK